MSRHGALLVAALAIASTGLVACDPMADKDFTDNRTAPAQLTELHIEGGAGSVTLRHDASASQTTIARHFRYHGAKPTLTGWDTVSGSVLDLNTTCGAHCDLDYTVTIPSTVKVTGHLDSGEMNLSDIGTATLETNSGRIVLRNAAGDVNAGTDSGSMSIVNVQGRLNLQSQSGSVTATRITGATAVSTDSGSVRVTELSGTQTSVHTQSGSVMISLSTAQNVTAETDSGSVRVTVPSGTYRVDQSSNSGRVSIGVPVDNTNGQHTLQLKTESGSITVTQA